MQLIPPHPPANMTSIPPPQDPPTLQDLTNAIKYVEDIKAGHREFGYPTAEDLAMAYVYRSTVINARAEAAVAPPWINGATTRRSALELLEDRIEQVNADLNMKIDQVNTKVDQMNSTMEHLMVELREIAYTTIKLHNQQRLSGEYASYKAIRFVDGTFPSDHRLPALETAQDISDLGPQDVKKYMDGYGIPSNSEDPKRAIANFIGCCVSLK